MIIREGNKSLEGKFKMIYAGVWYSAVEIYRGARLVWQAISSCFGSGAWLNDKPWLNTDGWKN